ncbi:hypothetical protein [Vibrio diabolicus]|uniref:hypothetical protein n=1 Tax=Vibrio diabolicus TaxID=50719 RepID=UPI00215F4617|nr:hypothetical protein [Vibrio diabolicus]MCS0306308.1 hypothetical protein [Vibrio diabolicus]
MYEIKRTMKIIHELHKEGLLSESVADCKLLDCISVVMSERLRESRVNGKRGWWNPEVCSIEFLKEQAIKNLGEGNVLDAIIFSAMVLLRNEGQTNTLVFDTSTLGDLTELAPRHCAFFEDIYDRITQANLSFELATPTTKAIMIAGKMLEQTMKEIERLNPHKESSTGELSPAIENMIEDAGLEITDVKHIILAAQTETQRQMCTALDQSAGRFEK